MVAATGVPWHQDLYEDAQGIVLESEWSSKKHSSFKGREEKFSFATSYHVLTDYFHDLFVVVCLQFVFLGTFLPVVAAVAD